MRRLDRLTANTLTLIGSNAGGALLALLISILIGRATGEVGLGVYVAALAWVFPLALLVDFGFGTLLTRDLAAANTVYPPITYMRTGVVARLIFGYAVLVVLLLGAPLLSRDPLVIAGIRIAAPLVIVTPFYGLFTAVFRAHRAMTPVAVLNLGMLSAQLLLTALVFLLRGGVLMALIVNVVTSTAGLAAAWAVWRWRFYIPDTAEDLPLMPLLMRAAPFGIAAVLAAIQMRVGVVWLEVLSTTAEVGYFGAASRFVEGARLVPQAFFDALLPTLTLVAAQRVQARRTFRQSAGWLTLYGLAFGFGCLVAAPLLLQLTYGFEQAAEVLRVLAWSLLPMTLRYARGLYYYAYGREAFVSRVTAVMILVQVGLGWLLLPTYGAVGAAWVAVIAESAGALWLWLRR